MIRKKFAYRRWILPAAMAMLISSCQVDKEGSTTAQFPEVRLVKLNYENSSGERGFTSYFYDVDGKNYLAHWQLEDSSRSSVNYLEYDSTGNQTRKYREFSDGITSDQHYSYNAKGLLSGEDFSRSDGVTGETAYQYDDQDVCISAICKGLNGWFFGELKFYYDSEGKRTGAGIYREGDSIGFIEYSYDYFGNLMGEYWDFNGEWNQTFLYEYQQEAARSFTSSNVFIRESKWFRVQQEEYTYNGETGGPSYYQYSDEGGLSGKEFFRSDGLSTMTTYRYDSTGILRSSVRDYHDGDSAYFHYWYSTGRKLLVRTFEKSDGESGSETYRYDDDDLLEYGELNNFDNWLNGTLTFEYDGAGLITAGRFEGNDGFDADLRFDYDLNQNLTAIHWDFSFGGYQKYIFIYEPL